MEFLRESVLFLCRDHISGVFDQILDVAKFSVVV